MINNNNFLTEIGKTVKAIYKETDDCLSKNDILLPLIVTGILI